MPGTPQQIVQEVPSALGKMKMTLYGVELPEEAKSFTVAFADYPPVADYADESFAHNVIDGIIAGVARSLKGEVQQKTKIKLGNHHGQECLLGISGRGIKCLHRVYLVGNRVYQISSSWSTNRGDTSADAGKFMNSFKVTD